MNIIGLAYSVYSRCKPGYSLGFGTSKCLPHCGFEDRYLVYFRVIGLIAVCAVAGVLLVVLLTLLNLTVAEGNSMDSSSMQTSYKSTWTYSFLQKHTQDHGLLSLHG